MTPSSTGPTSRGSASASPPDEGWRQATTGRFAGSLTGGTQRHDGRLRCFGRERRDLTAQLVDDRAERDGEHALTTLEQVDDLGVVVDHEDRRAVGHERDVGGRTPPRTEFVDGQADALQGHAGVDEALHHAEAHDVVERVQALRPAALGLLHRRLHEVRARPVVQLAVRDAHDLAHGGSAIALGRVVGCTDVEPQLAGTHRLLVGRHVHLVVRSSLALHRAAMRLPGPHCRDDRRRVCQPVVVACLAAHSTGTTGRLRRRRSRVNEGPRFSTTLKCALRVVDLSGGPQLSMPT